MIVYLCDRCGAGHNDVVRFEMDVVSGVETLSADLNGTYHLCYNCADLFDAWLDEMRSAK